MPTLSIIVPAYNVEKYVEDCIRSIMASTYTDFEILLVNDGSTDNTGAICDRLAKEFSQIRVFHAENGGVSKARNLGLDYAQGKYIGFVDSDDMVSPQMFEVLVEAMESKDVQLACCTYWSSKRNDSLLWKVDVYHITIADKLETARRLCNMAYSIVVWNKLFNRDIIEKNGIRFREDCRIAEDVFFTMDYFKHVNHGAFVERQLYFYIVTDGSIMNNWSTKKIGTQYTASPRAERYRAEVLESVSPELAQKAKYSAVMYYQRVLRRLKNPEKNFIREAQKYTRQYKNLLWQEPEARKIYFAGLLLCASYPLWAAIFRRGLQ
jgi:glycosyltransferase involved in cell wall biosynthesis